MRKIALAVIHIAAAAPALAHPGHGPEQGQTMATLAVAAILVTLWTAACYRRRA